MAGMSRQQELEAADHAVSTEIHDNAGTDSDECMLLLSSLSLFIQLRIPAREWCHP